MQLHAGVHELYKLAFVKHREKPPLTRMGGARTGKPVLPPLNAKSTTAWKPAQQQQQQQCCNGLVTAGLPTLGHLWVLLASVRRAPGQADWGSVWLLCAAQSLQSAALQLRRTTHPSQHPHQRRARLRPQTSGGCTPHGP